MKIYLSTPALKNEDNDKKGFQNIHNLLLSYHLIITKQFQSNITFKKIQNENRKNINSKSSGNG